MTILHLFLVPRPNLQRIHEISGRLSSFTMGKTTPYSSLMGSPRDLSSLLDELDCMNTRETVEWLEPECPFLSLPDEVISHIFSFLPIEDRLRARVNKRLDKIELESKYFVEEMLIIDLRRNDPFRNGEWVMRFKHRIILDEDKSYSTDFISRIAQNASIGELTLRLRFEREVVEQIKNLDVGWLFMCSEFSLDLTRVCKTLWIESWDETPEKMHELYKVMSQGTAKLGHFVVVDMCTAVDAVSFLSLIGIKYRDGKFYSNRDIQANESTLHETDDPDDDWVHIHIFDGNMQIICNDGVLDHDGSIEFIYHETEESLDDAKHGRKEDTTTVRLEILPE